MATIFGWIPLEEQRPPAPGQYLTRRDLRVEHGQHGLKKTYMSILPAYFDGQRFALPVQPQYYQAMPERE